MSKRIDLFPQINNNTLKQPTALVAASVIGAAALTGCSAEESKPAKAYECENLQDWTVQPGNTLSDLLEASGATKEAAERGEDNQLLQAIAHEATLKDLKFPDKFIVQTTGNISPASPVLHVGQQIEIPTRCEPLE